MNNWKVIWVMAIFGYRQMDIFMLHFSALKNLILCWSHNSQKLRKKAEMLQLCWKNCWTMNRGHLLLLNTVHSHSATEILGHLGFLEWKEVGKKMLEGVTYRNFVCAQLSLVIAAVHSPPPGNFVCSPCACYSDQGRIAEFYLLNSHFALKSPPPTSEGEYNVFL